MIRSIPQRLLLRCILPGRPFVAAQRPIVVAKRQYADKKSPSDNIASIPQADRPRHQVEESTVLTNTLPDESRDATPEMASPVGTPVEEITADGEKPEVTEAAEETQHLSKEAQALTATPPTTDTFTGGDDIPEANEVARKSILDLFGPETIKRSQPAPPVQDSTPDMEPKFNPLSAHDLDEGGLDLSGWEEARRAEKQKLEAELNPAEWADTTQRGVWETQDVERHNNEQQQEKLVESTPLHAEIREQFLQTPRPKPKITPLDLSIPEPTSSEPSPWDYFYPPAPPPRTLAAVQRSLNPTNQKSQKGVYDPFAAQEKEIKWPFFYNRDQLVDLCTNHIMRDGKKARAEKIMQEMFLIILEKFPRMHPVTLFAEALDKNAPLFKNKSTTLGSKAMTVPVPMTERQRIRMAWYSIINSAAKGSSTTRFYEKLANEVIKAYEGRSGGVQNRLSEHKKAMANKLNIKQPRTIVR